MFSFSEFNAEISTVEIPETVWCLTLSTSVKFLSSEFINDKTLAKVVNLLEPHKNGKCPLTIKCLSQKHIVPLNLDQEWFVNPSTMWINNLSDLLGKENIIVKYQ